MFRKRTRNTSFSASWGLEMVQNLMIRSLKTWSMSCLLLTTQPRRLIYKGFWNRSHIFLDCQQASSLNYWELCQKNSADDVSLHPKHGSVWTSQGNWTVTCSHVNRTLCSDLAVTSDATFEVEVLQTGWHFFLLLAATVELHLNREEESAVQ